VTDYNGVITLAPHIVDMSMYLKGNINLSDADKITLCVKLDPLDEAGKPMEIEDLAKAKSIGASIIQSHPNYSGKLVYAEEH